MAVKVKAQTIRKVSVRLIILSAIIVFGSIALITAFAVMAHFNSLRKTAAENEQLRAIADDAENSDGYRENLSALDIEMLQINPDYVFWIRIDGLGIDHPVVRGENNEKYLNISFYGERNIAGTLFMDYRIEGEIATYTAFESLPHIIIYGHNAEQGGMFKDLHRLKNERFLDENKIITITIHGQIVEFEIFSVRESDIYDPAYFLDFEAPRSFYGFANRIDAPMIATQILTLSTCVSRGNDDERLIVQAYRLMD